MPTFELTYHVHKSPESIRRWWLDFSDDYRATDKREQPHRIVTRARKHDEVLVTSYWRAPFGEMKTDETLRVLGDGSWTADTSFMGFAVHDEFRATKNGAGSRLDIRSTLTPMSTTTRILQPVLYPIARRMFRNVWRDAALLCERDAS